MGAVLARYPIPRDSMGLAVTIAMENGCYTTDPEIPVEDKPQDNVNKQTQQPRQLAFDFLRTTPYNETYHLKPNGKRRKK